MDVVYNNTAEGNERGPTLSFKGIDNASYYRLNPEQKRYYINDTGRHRKYTECYSPSRPPDGDGQPALLGSAGECRWIPFRSGHHSGAGTEWLRQPKRFPEDLQSGSRSVHCQV